jgi:diguanylate cyclase (GGDEF)-like protein
VSQRSLTAQLQSVLILSTVAVLLLAGSGSVAYEGAVMRESLRREMAVQADMIGANVSAALLFDDSHAAEEVLRIATDIPDLLKVEVLSAVGTVVATDKRQAPPDRLFEQLLRGLGVEMELSVQRPVVYNQKLEGSILLSWDLRPSLRSMAKQALVGLAILCGAVSVATLLGFRLQRRLISPILHLSSLAENVAQAKNYKLRATKFAEDEVGQLVDRFNEMLARIQERDSHLEKLVGDRTAELLKANEQLVHQAYFDGLTGLPNRHLFQDRVLQALSHAERVRKKVAVCFMDLDEFKHINDVFGHETGDKVLRQVASRVAGCLRDTDSVARIGGDEFMFLFTNLERPEAVGRIAEKILSAVQAPMHVDGQVFTVKASFGISIYPDDGSEPATLKKNADMAMYHAKAQGRNRYSFFTRSLDEQLARRLEIENNLLSALHEGQLAVYYQPQFDTEFHLVGFEALIRWRHPEKGMIPPGLFIPIAEQSGLITKIDEWVLQSVCRQLGEWRGKGYHPPAVSVNLSMKLFHQADLPERIARTVSDCGAKPSWIRFEVTESALMENAAQTVGHLSRIRELGFVLSIDDFGTGYSSLNYLKQFPVDHLKIDRGFVRDLASDKNDAAIVLAIISLAHSLGLSVVAEGVETEFQSQFLRGHGCDYLQGNLLGRPASAEVWEGLLLDRSDLPESGEA